MTSEVAGDGFQLVAIRGGMVFVKAMVHVIVDERPLGVGDGLLDRLQLLGDVKAGLAVLDHADHGPQMTVSTFQPGDQGGMGCMNMGICHMNDLSSPGG